MARTVEVRPALIADVVRVLQRRRDHMTALRYRVLTQRLPRGMYGVMDALRGAWMLGLVEHPGHLSPAHQTVSLTPQGLACDPSALEVLRYRWGTSRGQHAGTLEQYAREVFEGRCGAPAPGLILHLEDCPRPLAAQVMAHVLPDGEGGGFRVTAAGEEAVVWWDERRRRPATRRVPDSTHP